MGNRQTGNSTIRFSGRLTPSTASAAAGAQAVLALPGKTSALLPQQNEVMVEGTINGFPFRAALQPDSQGRHSLGLNEALQDAAGATAGDTVALEITRIGEEPELRVPAELDAALTETPEALAVWTDITPIARRDWILWICSGKQLETRGIRIEKACDMLASGKRRVCCFPGLTWLRKEHPNAGEPWLPLPRARK